MYLKCSICASTLLFSSFAYAADVEIKSVSVESMTSAHLCRTLGGQGKDPKLTIRHDKVAGARIRIRMFDTVSNGNVVNHRSTSVMSNGSGITTVSYNFLPPCNTTGNSISSYKFRVSSGGANTTVNWARYDSANKKIIR